MKYGDKIKKYLCKKLTCCDIPKKDDEQLGEQITKPQPKPSCPGDFPGHGLVKLYRSQLDRTTCSRNSLNERNLHKILTRHSISSFEKRNLSIGPISTCSSLSANRTSISGPQTCNTWETSNQGAKTASFWSNQGRLGPGWPGGQAGRPS